MHAVIEMIAHAALCYDTFGNSRHPATFVDHDDLVLVCVAADMSLTRYRDMFCVLCLEQNLEDLGDIMGLEFHSYEDVLWSPFTLCHCFAIREVSTCAALMMIIMIMILCRRLSTK